MRRVVGAAWAFLALCALGGPVEAASFVPGDRVVASSDLAVRATPSPKGKLLGMGRIGALGTVVDGPIKSGSTSWWNIDYEGALDGWSEAGQLTGAYFPPSEKTGGWRSLVPVNATPSKSQLSAVRSYAGIDWAKLDLARDLSEAASRKSALLVIRNGWVVGEWGSTSVGRPGSISKSLTALTLAKVLDMSAAGQLSRSVQPEDPVHSFVPATWSKDTRKRLITIDHLLTMTSGLEPNDRPYDPNYLNRILAQPYRTSPEREWSYQSMSVDLLSVAIQRLTGKTVRDLFNEQIAVPIGIPPVVWDGFEGYTRGSAGVRMTPRDLARIGYLMMMNGRWDSGTGQVEIVSGGRIGYLRQGPGCVQSAGFRATPDSPFVPDTTSNLYYGRLWWTNRAGLGLGENVPSDGFLGIGLKENLLIVVPSLDLVVVRLGEAPVASGEFRRELIKRVVDAIVTPPPTYVMPRVESLTLINNRTKEIVALCDPMPPNARIQLRKLGTRNLAFRANTMPATVGSVQFWQSSPSSAKVVANGPVTGSWLTSLGSHALSVTAYPQPGAIGMPGLSLNQTYTVE